jgi:glycosidase
MTLPLAHPGATRLLFAAGLCGLLPLAGAATAGVDATPILTLTPGETVRHAGPELAVGTRLPWMVAAPPPGLALSAQPGVLEITARHALPWRVVETTGGDLLVRTRDGQPVEVGYQGKPGLAVSVAGNFNDWNAGSHPLTETAPGRYRTTLAVPPGELIYLIKVGDLYRRDPANPDSVPNGFGSWNSRRLVEDAQGPPPRLHRLGWEAIRQGRELRFLVEGADPDFSWAALHGNRAVPADSVSRRGDTLVVRIADKARSGPDRLRLGVSRGTSRSLLQTVFFEQEDIWQDAVVYSLMPDRFRNGDPANDRPVSHPELLPPANWQGGDLAGLLATLREGYFERLGITTLWIFPLNQSTDKAWREYPEPHRWYTGYHGYWPVHPTAIEPRFGTEELFRDVTAEARRRGLRILLDLVANHVHEEHPWVREHPDWFGTLELPDGRRNLRIWDEHRLTTWFEPYMPDIDYSASPEAVAAMCEAALDWVKRYGLDGFRHDAVKHVPREFWQELTTRLKADSSLAHPLFQIGETFGSDELILSYVGPDVLDAQFNFNLFHPAREIFLDPARSFAELARILERNLSSYGPNSLMGNLMDSHDKARYAGYADGDLPLSGANLQELGWTNPPRIDHPETYDKVRLYLTWLLTLPGVPFLYYGDEIAMTGAEDPDNRRMMRFGDELDERERRQWERTAELVHLRRERPELRRGDLHVLHADQDLLVYLRSAEDARGRPSRSLVALNKSGEPRRQELVLPLGLGPRMVSLGPWEGRVIPLP